jgi:hypothetical protein
LELFTFDYVHLLLVHNFTMTDPPCHRFLLLRKTQGGQTARQGRHIMVTHLLADRGGGDDDGGDADGGGGGDDDGGGGGGDVMLCDEDGNDSGDDGDNASR